MCFYLDLIDQLFNPVLFKVPGTDKLVAICAVGSQDRGVSIWFTGTDRARIAATNLFTRGVLDLAWSRDGYHLLACSYDGSVQVLSFTPEEFGVPATQEERVTLNRGIDNISGACVDWIRL